MPFMQAAGQMMERDVEPDFDKVHLLLQGNGNLSGNSITNCDAGPHRCTITRISGAVQQPTGGKFGARLFGGETTTDSTTDAMDIDNPGDIPAFGTDDFTVEFWFNKTLANTTDISMRVFEMQDSALTLRVFLSSSVASTGYPGPTGVGRCVFYAGRSNSVLPGLTAAISINTYHHVAFSRQAGTMRCFFDGALVGSAADTTNYTTPTAIRLFNGINTTNRNLTGNIDDLRITIGLARYTAAFTPPTKRFASDKGTPRVNNYNFGYTPETLLLWNANGTNGQTTMSDSSSYNHTTQYLSNIAGLPAISTAQSKFGGSSWQTGTSSASTYAMAYIAPGSVPALGQADFCIQGFVRVVSNPSSQAMTVFRSYGAGDANTAPELGVEMGADTNRRFSFMYRIRNGTQVVFTDTTNNALNTWYHWAMTRQNGVLRFYRDGVLLGTGYSDAAYTSAGWYQGLNSILGGNYRTMNGFQDDFKIIRGAAIYTTDTFTVPTSEQTTSPTT